MSNARYHAARVAASRTLAGCRRVAAMRSPARPLPRSCRARLSSRRSSTGLADGRRCAVFLVADVRAPRRAVAFLVDLDHREVRHEARRCGAVPVVLIRLEEHAVARADHLDRRATALDETDALCDVDRLSVRMRVPRGARAWCEVDAARAQTRWA